MKLKFNPTKDLALYLFGLVCGLWFIGLGAIHYQFIYFPGDYADARFNNYLLEHAFRFLSGQESEFWSAGFMYPEKDVISYSDNLLGTAPFYGLFRIFGADRETAFQCWYVLMCALNYSAAFLFLRFVVKNSMAAVCGALVFAFSIALQSQIVHAQTFPRFMVPLALWAAVLYQRELRPRYLFLALMAWVYQMYCGIYLGFMLLVPLLLLLGSSFITRWGKYRLKIKSSRWWLLIGAAIVVSVAALLPVMLPYLERSKQTGFYPYEQVIQTLPTPKSWLYGRHGTLFWQVLQDLCVYYANFWDFILFPGGVAVLCSLAVALLVVGGLVFKRNRWLTALDSSVTVLLLVGAMVFVLFLRWGNHSAYYILYQLPGFGSMRALQRIVNIEVLFFGLAVAIVFAHIFRRVSANAWMYFVVLVLLIIADNYTRHDYYDKTIKADAQRRVTDLIAKVDVGDSATVLSYEPDTVVKQQIFFQLDAMLASQSLNIKTLNGYTATSPVGYDAYWRIPNEASRRVWVKQSKMDTTHLQIVH